VLKSYIDYNMANTLTDVDWKAHIRIADKDGTQHKDTRALMNLTISSSETVAGDIIYVL